MIGPGTEPSSAPEPVGAPDRRRRGAALAAGALGVAVALIALMVWSSEAPIGPSPSPSSTPDVAIASTSPSPSPSSAATPPSGTPGPNAPWGSLALEPVPQIALISAARTGPAGIATDTTFTLTSLGADDAAALARAIEVTPPLDLRVRPGADGRSATLEPKAALPPGGLYRFTLHGSDGTLAGSWAFQVAAPLHVVTTVPYDQATDVPVDTGIELKFDQDGVLDAASHFSIEPAAPGRFEQHGRTLVFVPERLAPATFYTVTLSRGVRLQGSDQALEEDAVVRFETAAPAGTQEPVVSYRFGRPMVEAPTGERPVLALSIWYDEARSPGADRKPFELDVYRLPTEQAGIDAVRTVAGMPDWARWSTIGLVSIDGLSRVGSSTVTPVRLEGQPASWVRLPWKLPAGWYLVEIPSQTRAVQVVLQVTDVAAYVAAATDRMLVWANDIADGRPLDGATVELVDGSALGRTDANGLLVTMTPPQVGAAATSSRPIEDGPFVAVRVADGRSLVVPVGPPTWTPGYAQDRWSGSDPSLEVQDRLWRFMATDRWEYRPTDAINVWGFLRERDTGRVPNAVELRLTGSGCCWVGPEQPPLAVVPVHPDATGAFAASIGITDLPYGGYSVALYSGDVRISDTWVSVSFIRKPAYQIDLETDRHVLVAGDQVEVTARASFFDGTPVPGVRLAVDAFGKRTLTTDRAGVATVQRSATTAQGVEDGESWTQATATPARSEEGEISGSANLLVFPSSVRLEAEGSVEGGRVTVTGSLHQVAVGRLERAWGTDGWDTVDWNGPAVGGARVSASIVDLVPVRTKTGQTYDFISKKVVNTYEYRIDEVRRGTQTIRTTDDGSLSLSAPATADHNYRIVLSATDSAGRVTRLTVHATAPWTPWQGGPDAPLLVPDCGLGSVQFAIGDPICLAVSRQSGPMPSGGSNRYLFFTAQRGLRDTVVGEAPKFRSQFTAADVPNLEIAGAWFTGGSIVPIEDFNATFDQGERELKVTLATDRERYAPGGTVTLDVRTTDPAGAPVRASVILRAVDEKLFAMGAAYDPDLLGVLYRRVGSWLIWSHSSHPLPVGTGGGYGDTTGGGGRNVFVDSLLFRAVTTDADGRAQVSFKLSDDLTSWHVSAAAMTAVPEAGSGAILVPVGLPFFVETTLAPEYLVTDEPIIRLRAYGSGLTAGDPVTFTVSSTSLGLPRTTVQGVAFEDAELPLPALALGEQAITISGSSGSGSTALTDRLTRRFTVVGSRLLSTRTTYSTLTSGARPEGGPGFTDYLFIDAGRGRYLPVLQSLAWSGGPRVDQALAAAIARDLLVGEFGIDPATLPSATFDSDPYQRWDGVALLPYSSPDLALTSRISLLAGDRFERDGLVNAFGQQLNAPSVTREQRVEAYAGLAGLGENVLVELRELAAESDLTIRERLYAALGITALGDDTSALAIEQELLAAYGERRGPWIRLRVGESLDDTVEATSLLAILAADLGDPLADDAEAYVDANPAVDELYSLQQAAFIGRMLDRTPAETARFAYAVDGKRTVVDLDPGESVSLRLIGKQRATLELEQLAGQVSVATSWQVPIGRESVVRDPDLELARTYTPFPAISADSMVEVRLTATFGPQVVAGCHEVSDLAPSGLAPLASVGTWPDDGATTSSWVTPYRIEGQRVSFCVGPSKDSRIVKMRYFARIVTPGTYTWEPAVIQSALAPESVNLTSGRQVTIR